MKAHFVGSSSSADATAQRAEVSLAVLQFVELVRGERPVCRPRNRFRVEKVVAEEHYCLSCFGLRTFDVVYPRNPLWKVMRRCRCCGKEGGG